MRILVVDDDANTDWQYLFKAFLIRSGPVVNGDVKAWERRIQASLAKARIEIDFVLDGDQAFKRYCEKGRYDLVLTDFYHPGLDGLELAKAIRHKNPEQAIAMYTGGIPDSVLLCLLDLDIPLLYKFDPSAIRLQSLEEVIAINEERIAKSSLGTVLCAALLSLAQPFNKHLLHRLIVGE